MNVNLLKATGVVLSSSPTLTAGFSQQLRAGLQPFTIPRSTAEHTDALNFDLRFLRMRCLHAPG